MGGYGGFRPEGKVIDVDGKKMARGAVFVIVGFFLLMVVWSSLVSVPAGHVAVLTLFGKVQTEILGEGIHMVNPMKSAHRITVQTQEIKEAASVPSSEGLVMTLDTSLLFRVNSEKAGELFQKVGPRYRETIIEPNVRSAVRTVTAAHTANALYSGERERVAQQIRTELERQLGPRGIIVESLLLRDIQLPQTLKVAIEAKQQAEQESLAMGFRLQKEKQEAERKRIEAEGIRDFQRTVSQGISPELLTWKGIEATETLAKSPNTKIVVIGNTKNGLPLVLSGKD